MRHIVKNHKSITSDQWDHIRAILILKDNVFPEKAYSDDPQFNLDESDTLPLRLQASVAQEYFDTFNAVIERQMQLTRPNWARWMSKWLASLGKIHPPVHQDAPL